MLEWSVLGSSCFIAAGRVRGIRRLGRWLGFRADSDAVACRKPLCVGWPARRLATVPTELYELVICDRLEIKTLLVQNLCEFLCYCVLSGCPLMPFSGKLLDVVMRAEAPLSLSTCNPAIWPVFNLLSCRQLELQYRPGVQNAVCLFKQTMCR
jgi:hypothetical protein